MHALHLGAADQALFIFDHLEGEAKEEIKFHSAAERGDTGKVFIILKEPYGCAQPYVSLQQAFLAFFSWHQLGGETAHKFSLAIMALMAQVKQCTPDGVPNADVLFRDQFIEHVLDCLFGETSSNLFTVSQLSTCWTYAVRQFAGRGRVLQGA